MTVAWNDAKPAQEKAVFGGFFAVYLVQSIGAIDVGFKEIDARILGRRVSALEFVALIERETRADERTES